MSFRIDLRTRGEVAACPNKSNLVLETPKPPMTPRQIKALAERVLKLASKLPKDETIEVFCAKGKRSGVAAAVLRQAGYNVVDRGAAKCNGKR